MGLYEKYILPRIVHLACSSSPTRKQREKVVPLASGRVLEIGVGSGLNLAFYNASKVEKVWGLDPSPEMTWRAEEAAEQVDFEFEVIGLPGREIPLEGDTVDTVLVTYTLCTIPETKLALRQMARVLKPGGQLIFCEHGAAPDEKVRRWQNRINPIWKRFGGGCHLNRDIPAVLEEGGFQIRDLETMYLPGWRPASFNYWGTAAAR
jgi:ubiquinone/menaquinone biosynthesis C-methylase UbiE